MALKDMKEIEKIDRQRAVGDNMNGEERANKKLNMRTADLSDKMNITQINKYINAYQAGDPVKDLIPPGLTKSELIQLQKLAEKRS